MKDEPKIQAAIDAALKSEPVAEERPNPKREVPLPDTFTRVEDFLNTPLFEKREAQPVRDEGTEEKAKAESPRRPSPGTLLHIVSLVAGLASLSAAFYWYSSARDYQRVSADLAGELSIAHQQRAEVVEKVSHYEQSLSHLESQAEETVLDVRGYPVPVFMESRDRVPTKTTSAAREGVELE